jgi:hypothetical protein
MTVGRIPVIEGGIQPTIFDAKADLLTATANDTPARLAVGANNYFLQAASGESTGLQWGGAYTAYTPTTTNITLGNGTKTGRYLLVGKMCHVEVKIVFGSTTTIGSPAYLSLPFNVATLGAFSTAGDTSFQDSGTSNVIGGAVHSSANEVILVAYNTAGTYISEAAVSATVPFTWTTNDVITFSYVYEVA